MELNVEKLLNEFQNIYQKKWVKGVNNNTSSVGLTFEKMLNKKIDSDIFPDYKDIEIKCSQRFSRYPISLFNQSFDGPHLFETKNILEKYGKCYSDESSRKFLFVNLVCDDYALVNNEYYFKLNINYIERKIYIEIYDLEYTLLDSPFIDFKTLEEHLKIKLNNLALIYASKKEKFGDIYFRYYALYVYKLKSVDVFYQLIEKNIIKLNVMCRSSFANDSLGKNKNKGVTFKLSKKDIELLFEKVLEYNADFGYIIFNNEYYFKN